MRISVAAAIVLIAACHEVRTDRGTATATVPPADPRPAPTATAPFAAAPIITTAGSPRPAAAVRATMERVVVDDGTITARPLIPRGDAAFELDNQGRLTHSIVISGSSSIILEPGEKQIVTLDLREPSYTLRCDVPGHREEFRFRTYEPR